MHRTYSMRQSRAPTASQLQNPPPPSSSTKAGRLFGKGGIGQYISYDVNEASVILASGFGMMGQLEDATWGLWSLDIVQGIVA